MNPLALARPEIRELRAYQPEPLDGDVLLHANESPWPAPGQDSLQRYPEAQPVSLRGALAGGYAVSPERILLTRGSDDAIDLLVRSFCRPGRDSVVGCSPTFGMYAVSAAVQGAPYRDIPLRGDDFRLDATGILACADLRLVFVCSPNNPTGGRVPPDVIAGLCRALRDRALVVVDEAYAEFSTGASAIGLLGEHANLVVLRTLSKAHALAGARLGVLLADPAVVALLRRVMPPYPLPTPSLAAAARACTPEARAATRVRVDQIVAARDSLREALAAHPAVDRVWPSDANFLLLRWCDPASARQALHGAGIVTRWFDDTPALSGCTRISIGTQSENARLLETLETLR